MKKNHTLPVCVLQTAKITYRKWENVCILLQFLALQDCQSFSVKRHSGCLINKSKGPSHSVPELHKCPNWTTVYPEMFGQK